MTSIGITNATNTTNNTAQGIGFQDITNTVGVNIGEKALGSPEIAGMLLLMISGFTLYRSGASLDISAAVMIPTVFFLADFGYLPMGEGLVYGVLLTAAALLSFGLAKRFR